MPAFRIKAAGPFTPSLTHAPPIKRSYHLATGFFVAFADIHAVELIN